MGGGGFQDTIVPMPAALNLTSAIEPRTALSQWTAQYAIHQAPRPFLHRCPYSGLYAEPCAACSWLSQWKTVCQGQACPQNT